MRQGTRDRHSPLVADKVVSRLCACYAPVLAFSQLNILLRRSNNLGKQIGDRGKYTHVKEKKT